jgi:anaerobic selenocysteine-containing dehydrogenase
LWRRQFLTPAGRHADIVLPATSFWQRNDVHTSWAGAGHYAIYMKQAIQPMYECRDDRAIFADLTAGLVPAAPMAFVGMRSAANAMDDEKRKRVLETVACESEPVLRSCSDASGLAFEFTTNLATARGRRAAPPTITLRHPICRHLVSRMSRMQAMATTAVATRTLKAVP